MTHTERADRRKAVATMVQETGDWALVSQRFGLTRATVMEACREFGVPIPAKPPAANHGSLGANTYRIIADLLTTGDPLGDIAARHGVTTARVSQVHTDCLKNGVPVKRRPQGANSNGGTKQA